MIWRTVEKLKDRKPHLTKTRFGEVETAAGLHFVPDGVLFNPQLRPHVKPAQMIAVDPMHVLVSNGVVNFELAPLFHSCGWNRCFEAMRTLIAVGWKLPRGVSRNKLNVFDEAHMRTQAAQAIAAGAHAVVVGSAITRIEHVTGWFAEAVSGAGTRP